MDWRGLLIRALATTLVILLLLLVRALLRCHRYRRGSPARRNPKQSKRPCAVLSGRVYRRPDPLIYSQKYLISLGLAVTWDNPDIHLEKGGVPVPPHSLQPDTTYDIIARIWNGSTSAPAINMPVRFSYLDFGIGGINVPIGETRVDLPVKGALGCPAFTSVAWTTPATPGHYCIQVQLVWSDDANPNNNLGQTNVDVKPLNSPHAAFSFPVRNDSLRPRVLTLELDSYEIPLLDPCQEQASGTQSDLTKAEIIKLQQKALLKHGRHSHAIPNDWRLGVDPHELRLAPGEQRHVGIDITAPDSFSGQQAINVNAFEGGLLVGGVTLYVQR